MAAYCSGEGRYEGIGSLLGLFVGGGGTAAMKNNISQQSINAFEPALDLRSIPFIS